MTNAPEHPSTRLLALDGLRGVAAFVVVLHHALLTVPGFAAAYFPHSGRRLGPLTDTPLHIVGAGPEAVLVFFVLSGFVLVRSTDARNFSWGRYYPQRLARIYLPLAGSVVLAAALLAFRPRFDGGVSPWLREHDRAASWSDLIGAFTLVQPASSVNSVLWTLRLEVGFSLVLPLVVLVVARVRRRGALVLLAAAITVSGVLSILGAAELRTVPAFAAGALLARVITEDGLGARRAHAVTVTRLRAATVRRTVSWSALLVAITAPWWCAPGDLTTQRALFPVALLAAVGMVWAAASGGAPSWLSSPLLVWAGGISFSLYLVHEPVLVAVASIAPEYPWIVFAIGIPAGLATAAAFHRWWERPVQQWAKTVGARPRMYIKW